MPVTLIVMSALEVSFIATTVFVAGNTIPITIKKWNDSPQDLDRCALVESRRLVTQVYDVSRWSRTSRRTQQ